MKKRLLILPLLAGALLLGATSCGGSSKDDPGGHEMTKTLVSISVSGQTTSYEVDDAFKFDGICKAIYDDKSQKIVVPTQVSDPNMSKAGEKNITVVYEENGVVVETNYTITVFEKGRTLTSIYASGGKREYIKGESIDFSSMEIIAAYSNGDTEIVPLASCTISDIDMNKIGEQEVVITYLTKSYSFNINIKEKAENPFEQLVHDIVSKHNYTVDILTYLVDHPDEVYEDSLINIDDKAIYANYYSGHRGYIYQKGQGYIGFIQTVNGDIIPDGGFYATNPDVGISSIYDLNAENLFLSEYELLSDGLYHCHNQDVIAVASNFTGYATTSWFIAPEEVIIKVEDDESLTVYIDFTVAYYNEEYERIFESGVCQLNINNIGSTVNEKVSEYINEPTTTYVAPTGWNETHLSYFKDYYNGLVMPFLTNPSYSFTFESVDSYDGVNLLLTDLNCGNQLTSYREMISQIGFAPIDETNLNYSLVVKDYEKQITITYTVEMVYLSPQSPYYGRTIGLFYPNGVLQMLLKCRITNDLVNSVPLFNKYIYNNGLTDYVPYLIDDGTVTKISNFEDRTNNMNQLYGKYYLFYTINTLTRLYVDEYQKAKEYAEAYIELLKECGYTNINSENGLLYLSNDTWNDSYTSNVVITDFNYYTDASYSGYIQIKYTVYIPDHPKEHEETNPLITVEHKDHLLSYSITDVNEEHIATYDKDLDEGYFYVSFNCTDGYIVSSLIIEEDKNASIIYNNETLRWEIKPSSGDLTSITLVPTLEKNGYYLSFNETTGANIRFINPTSPSYVPSNSDVKFVIELEEDYDIVRVYLLEDESYPILKNPIGNNSYYFSMPSYDATIAVDLTYKGEPIVVTLTSIQAKGMDIIYEVDDAFSFNGVLTAYYSNNTSSNVEPTYVSSVDTSTAGEKVVTIGYEENDIYVETTYNISVKEKPVPIIDDEVSGTYLLYNGKANTYEIILDEESGQGVYRRTWVTTDSTYVYEMYFTFTMNDDHIIMVLTGFGPNADITSFQSGYRLFIDGEIGEDIEPRINGTGIFNGDGTIDIMLCKYDGSVSGTYTFNKEYND